MPKKPNKIEISQVLSLGISSQHEKGRERRERREEKREIRERRERRERRGRRERRERRAIDLHAHKNVPAYL